MEKNVQQPRERMANIDTETGSHECSSDSVYY